MILSALLGHLLVYLYVITFSLIVFNIVVPIIRRPRSFFTLPNGNLTGTCCPTDSDFGSCYP